MSDPFNNPPRERFQNHNLPDPALPKDWVSSPNVLRTDKNIVVKDKITLSDVELNLQTGLKVKRRALVPGTATHYAFADDFYLAVTNLGVAATINLQKPSIVGMGKMYIVKDESGSAGSTTITIVSAGGEAIESMVSTTIAVNFGTMRFITDGANWFTI